MPSVWSFLLLDSLYIYFLVLNKRTFPPVVNRVFSNSEGENIPFPTAGISMRRSRACRHAPYKSHALDLSRSQHLKPRDDESEDSNDDSVFDAFAEEMDSN